MKILIITLFTLFSLQSFAKEVTIVNDSLYKIWPATTMFGSFNYNKSLGRAWVEVEFTNYNSEDWGGDEIQRVHVEGMSYDSVTNEVIIEDEGERIVCAKRKKSMMGYYLKETKACTFKTINYNKMVDDGFEIKKVPYLKLVLKY